MTDNKTPEYEDVSEALAAGRELRKSKSYRIKLARGSLDFAHAYVADPIPLGRQILDGAGLDSRDEYSLFAILPSGDFEDIRLDEPFDLRAKGAERFVAFISDRDFKLTLDDRQLEWGKPVISGSVLYKLAKLNDDEAIFLEVRGGTDRLLAPDELINLNDLGIERFVTAPKPPQTYTFKIGSRPHTVEDPKVTYKQLVQLSCPGDHAANIMFTVTYRHAASTPTNGELGQGGCVEVKQKGTIFNVTRAIQS
ncbi:MAG: multiubiquitin domain-containing protein [Akkermansiaceae bacterium]